MKCMKTLKILGWGSLALLIVIQAVPVHRENPPVTSDITAPENVHQILVTSCYDCHSHQTRWPWYSRVAPASWLIASDVKGARERLNFSQWDKYNEAAKAYLTADIVKEVAGGDMPPRPYSWMHRDTRVSPESLAILKEWSNKQGERKP